MKSYLSLVRVSARVHKRQSRMTRICIILAVFLVTSIFSMAEMWVRAEKTQIINKHGNYHIILQKIPEDKAELIRKQPDIAASSWYDEINPEGIQDYFINGKKTVLYGVEEAYITDIRNGLAEGSWPGDNREAVLSADAQILYGIHTGDPVTVNTPAGNFEYTVSGFFEDDTEFNQIIDGFCVYLSQPAFEEVRSSNHEDSMSRYYIRFRENVNLQKAIEKIRGQFGLASENIKENTAVLGLEGASSNETIKNIYPLAAFCFLLILTAGVLMISSCLNSNIVQRTKFFGMMRCLGASRQQIVRFVRLEALNWCKTAIPEGCLLGLAVCWILCAILRFLVKGEWVDMPLFGVSLSGIFCGAAVGVITVFIAAHSPAKQAARVSPVTAVSGSTDVSKNKVPAANTRLFKIETLLGISHAVRAKKNLFLMTGSFALTIVLFLTFSACLDMVHKLIPSVGNFTPDVTITSQDNSNSIDFSLKKEILDIADVKAAFGTMLITKCPMEINGSAVTADLFSYDEFMMDAAQKAVVSGNLSKVHGDSGYVMAVYSQGSRLDVGDKIKIGDTEAEIACVVSEGVGSISGGAVIVCSEETFTRLTGEQKYTMVSIVLKKDVSEAAVNEIRALAGSNLFTDNREENHDLYGSYWVFRLAAYGFLGIISFIAVLNIMNGISMGVSARIKQFGVMRAVGMENRQVIKMITAEAVSYAASGTITGFILGLLLHYLIYSKIIITYFGGGWKIPMVPMLIVLLLVSVSCVLAVYAPSKRIGKMAITDTINEL